MEIKKMNEIQIKKLQKECQDRLREIYKLKHLGQMFSVGSMYKGEDIIVYECSLCGCRNTDKFCPNPECSNRRRK